jgi:hypothetical protein
MDSEPINRSNVSGTLLAAAVVLLCAWPLAFFTMAHYLPEVETDEVSYFLQIKTFFYHGLHGGYFFANDDVPASPIHFDMHGPGFAVIYGLIARAVGWRNYSPYIANLLVFVPSWLLLVVVTRKPSNRIAIAVFVLLHAYFLLFLPSAMQETLQFSTAVVCVVLWSLAMDRQRRAAWTALALVIVVASLVRPTWALAIPVLLFSFLRQRVGTANLWTPRNVGLAAAALAVGAISTLASIRLLAFWTLPTSAPVSEEIFRTSDSLATAVRAFLSFRSLGVFGDWPLYFRVGTWVLVVAFAAIAVFGGRRNRELALYSLGLVMLPLIAQLKFYSIDGWRDFRQLAPFHAMAGLSFAASADFSAVTRHRAWRYAVVATSVLLIGLNLTLAVIGVRFQYEKNWRHRTTSRDLAGGYIFGQIGDVMRVAPSDSAFCKTLYIQVETFNDARLIHLPLGFGVSTLKQTEPGKFPHLKGKYVLMAAHYLTTRDGLMAMGINPDNHEAIIGAELAGRIPQGRASGWADDDPHNPKPDWKDLIASSGEWRLEKEADDFALWRSTTNCQD